MALFKTLPTPTNDLLPSLMVEVYLVLAPDVNFFLNSRKQGLPCWRSLSFFLSFLSSIQVRRNLIPFRVRARKLCAPSVLYLHLAYQRLHPQPEWRGTACRKHQVFVVD